MGFLDNSTITVDAILTKRGREMAGRRELDRFFYGRKKKEPEGTKV